jgi:hypothetical protein
VYQATERIKSARRFFIQEFKPTHTLNAAFSHIRPFSQERIARIRRNVEEILRSEDREPGFGDSKG